MIGGMSASASSPAGGRDQGVPVQTFRPTSGGILGWVALVAAAAVAVVALLEEPNLLGVRVVLGAALVALVVWVTLLRPRAAAYADTLVLRNLLSDTHLPLARVDAAVVRQVLHVWIGDDCYRCVGIGRSSRSLMGRRNSGGAMAVIGLQQVDGRVGAGGQGADVGRGADYATFVETRIEDLARAARRDHRTEPPVVRRVWARRELAALAVLATTFALSLLL